MDLNALKKINTNLLTNSKILNFKIQTKRTEDSILFLT